MSYHYFPSSTCVEWQIPSQLEVCYFHTYWDRSKEDAKRDQDLMERTQAQTIHEILPQTGPRAGIKQVYREDEVKWRWDTKRDRNIGEAIHMELKEMQHNLR